MTNILLFLILVALIILIVVIWNSFKEIQRIFVEKIERLSTSHLDWIYLNLEEITRNSLVNTIHLQADFPAGQNSSRYKRLENLAKIYAKHLVNKKWMSDSGAILKANFDVWSSWDNESEIRNIGGPWNSLDEIFEEKSADARKKYLSSDPFADEVNAHSNGIYMHQGECLEVMINLIKKENYKKWQIVRLNDEYETDIDKIIKNKAIVSQLEKLGIIEKINKDGWGDNPKWVVKNTNLNQLKKIIYEWWSIVPEDKELEDNFQKGNLKSLFFITT